MQALGERFVQAGRAVADDVGELLGLEGVRVGVEAGTDADQSTP